MKLAKRVIAEASTRDEHSEATAFAVWLSSARLMTLSADDLARIDGYAGTGTALHEMLPAVLPLARPVWYEAQVVAQRGTPMRLGYGATQAGPGEIDVWFAAGCDPMTRIVVLGPLRIDSQCIDPAADASDPSVRELRVAAGIVLRAMLMGLGNPT